MSRSRHTELSILAVALLVLVLLGFCTGSALSGGVGTALFGIAAVIKAVNQRRDS